MADDKTNNAVAAQNTQATASGVSTSNPLASAAAASPSASAAPETAMPAPSTPSPAVNAAVPEDTMLVGSSIQPSRFALTSGLVMSLGDVVATAYKNSGVVNIKAWNELENDVREKYIQVFVESLSLKKEVERDMRSDFHKALGDGMVMLGKMEHFTTDEITRLGDFLTQIAKRLF